jgi:hypothetical protein
VRKIRYFGKELLSGVVMEIYRRYCGITKKGPFKFLERTRKPGVGDGIHAESFKG